MLPQDLLFSGFKFGVGEYSRFMQLSELLQLRQVVSSQAARWRCCGGLRWRWLLLCCLLILHVSDLRILLSIRLLLFRRFCGRVVARSIGYAAYCSGP
jgi:hypothetical protein